MESILHFLKTHSECSMNSELEGCRWEVGIPGKKYSAEGAGNRIGERGRGRSGLLGQAY